MWGMIGEIWQDDMPAEKLPKPTFFGLTEFDGIVFPKFCQILTLSLVIFNGDGFPVPRVVQGALRL
jgi:hypothetical protein